jgi:hypothetical protein
VAGDLSKEVAMSRMSKPLCLAAMAGVLSVAGYASAAAYLDVYEYDGVSEANPPNPTYDPTNDRVNWPSPPWRPLVIPMTEPRMIPPGGSWFVGLTNRFEPLPLKVVTLEYFTGGVVPAEGVAGYPDGTTTTWTMSLKDSTVTYRKFVGFISPQPVWEWIELRNLLETAQPVRIHSFTSECRIPEPTILGGAVLMGVSLLRTRRAA